MGFRNARDRLRAVCRFLGYGIALTCLPAVANEGEPTGTSVDSEAVRLIAVPRRSRSWKGRTPVSNCWSGLRNPTGRATT